MQSHRPSNCKMLLNACKHARTTLSFFCLTRQSHARLSPFFLCAALARSSTASPLSLLQRIKLQGPVRSAKRIWYAMVGNASARQNGFLSQTCATSGAWARTTTTQAHRPTWASWHVRRSTSTMVVYRAWITDRIKNIKHTDLFCRGKIEVSRVGEFG
jgi:hypothetical protein